MENDMRDEQLIKLGALVWQELNKPGIHKSAAMNMQAVKGNIRRHFRILGLGALLTHLGIGAFRSGKKEAPGFHDGLPDPEEAAYDEMGGATRWLDEMGGANGLDRWLYENNHMSKENSLSDMLKELGL